jgi:hypothetical protein
MNKAKKTKKLKRGCLVTAALFVFPCAISVIVVLLLFWHSRLLEITTYEFHADSVGTPFTIAFIADHHNTPHGENQEDLLALIRETAPDIILLGGDIVCHVGTREESAALIAGAVEIAPTYYVSGNHEQANPEYSRIRAEIRDLGAVVLQNEIVELDIRDNRVILAGSNDISVFNRRVAETGNSAAEIRNAGNSGNALTILLTHFPERAVHYSEYGFGLIFAGHAHGGQVRIPLIAPGGLYSPGQGAFPEYTGGKYELPAEDGGSALIVTRGLSLKRSARFRLNNRPELVFVNVHREVSS